MSDNRQFIQAQWTDERREVADLAWEALRSYPNMEVVRFVLPFPPPLYAPEPAPVSPSFRVSAATVTRQRLRLHFNGPGSVPDRSLVARIHDPRNDDTFYVSDYGNIFEVQK